MKTSCIEHPPKTQLLLIRGDYLVLCEGDHCQAALLAIFEYWTNVKLGQKEQAEIENEIARAGNHPATQSADLWIYKTQSDLHAELFGLFGEKKIANALTALVNKGFLKRRRNPKYHRNRTYQYLLDVAKAQASTSQKDRTKER